MSAEQPPLDPTVDPAPRESATWPPAPVASEDSQPSAPPGYEILGVLGRGGMGVVYKARQLSPRRLIALKMVLDADHASADALARFRAEAEAVARLQHPGIVGVHEVGQHKGHPFFSMEFVEGGSLARLLHEQRLSVRESAQLLHQIALAVHHAHQRGILHRDLKPANILLAELGATAGTGEPDTRWLPRITDFGLARRLDETATTPPQGPHTRTGSILGTPAYMAPEQAASRHERLGPHTDVYALGAILYECLTGRPPFTAESALELLLKITSTEPQPPRRLDPRIPRDLETICLKCLRKEPEKRYASALDLAADLRRFLDGEPITARPLSGPARVRRWLRRHKQFVSVAAGALASLLGVVLVGLVGWVLFGPQPSAVVLPDETGPEILISSRDEPPTPWLDRLQLRPGVGPQAFYLYLKNPYERPWPRLSVNIRQGGFEHVFPDVILGPFATQRILGMPVLAQPLQEPIRIGVRDRDNGDKLVASRELALALARPEEYVQLEQVNFYSAGGTGKLEVRLRPRKPMPGPPVLAKLVFPPAEQGGATANNGTFRNKLPARGDLVLVANGVRTPDQSTEGLLGVNVDGWARAFTFQAIRHNGQIELRQIEEPVVRLRVAPVAVPGRPFAVPLEVDNAPSSATIEVRLGRLAGGTFHVERTASRPTPRQQLISFSPSGRGALEFSTTWRDWTIHLDTTGLRGPHELRVRLLDARGEPLMIVARTVMLDNALKAGAEFLNPPLLVGPRTPIRLRARYDHGGAGVKQVSFFIGKPAGDRIPPNTAAVDGKPIDATHKTWSAAVPIPKSHAGWLDVSVACISQDGGIAFGTTRIEVAQSQEVVKDAGRIRGTVTESGRRQAGLEVRLVNDRGDVIRRGKTSNSGAFEFRSVRPGQYRVLATKPANGHHGAHPRKPNTFLKLPPGSTVTAAIVLHIR